MRFDVDVTFWAVMMLNLIKIFMPLCLLPNVNGMNVSKI